MNYSPPRKPRQVRGTAAAKAGSRFALAVLGVGSAIGLLFHFAVGFDFPERFQKRYGYRLEDKKYDYLISKKTFTTNQEPKEKTSSSMKES